MKYPYQGRDLLREPEFYFYAQCADPGFYRGWHAYRQKRIARLRAHIEECEEHPVPSTAPARVDDGIRLADYLLEVRDSLESGQSTTEQAERAVEPFVRKYEVFKRLFEDYRFDLRRKQGSAVASPGTYVVFAECLALLCDGGGNLQHLSTLLKLCDVLCSLPEAAFSMDEAVRFVHVLWIEQRAVAQCETTCACSL
jgi:hypothetical protein